MKILCLIDALSLGGAERQIIGLSLLLQKRGYNTDLVVYHNHDFYVELVRKYGLKFVTLHPKDNKLSKFNAVKKYIKNAGGYDYVIAYKDGPCTITCLLKILGFGFHLIVSERNTTQEQDIDYKIRIKFFLYRWADKIVPNSYSQEEFIKSNCPKLAKKTIVITNFTDTELFKPPIATSNHSGLIVMTAARIAKKKNILNYLMAIKRLKEAGYSNIHFDWYGDVQTGEESYGQRCFEKLSELNIDDMIKFHPATSKILSHYQNCDIFCLPSISEGFPNVICEAMCCEKPILCSRVCDNPHIVQEYINGLFFNPDDIDDIFNQLKAICAMPKDQLNKWGENSRKISKKLFSEEIFVNKYIKLIENR